MNKYLKIIAIIAIVLIFTIGVVAAASITTVDAGIKKVDTKKKEIVKFKVVKTTKTHKYVIINGENQTLKKVPHYGRYSPQTWKNKKYIMTYGARGTNGGTWKPAGYRVFENRITSKKTGKPVSPWGSILVNPKGVSDGEFTVRYSGIYNDGDYCTQTGREKWYSQRTYMKRIV